MTTSLLDDCEAVLERWRDRLDQWSRHPSRPMPADWRAAVMMGELESAESIEPGAKFEAFTYADRKLAVDLTRTLYRLP